MACVGLAHALMEVSFSEEDEDTATEMFHQQSISYVLILVSLMCFSVANELGADLKSVRQCAGLLLHIYESVSHYDLMKEI